jgi:hypothetical protein
MKGARSTIGFRERRGGPAALFVLPRAGMKKARGNCPGLSAHAGEPALRFEPYFFFFFFFDFLYMPPPGFSFRNMPPPGFSLRWAT